MEFVEFELHNTDIVQMNDVVLFTSDQKNLSIC